MADGNSITGKSANGGYTEDNGYCLDPKVAAKIRAECPPIQYPGGMVPLKTLRDCGVTGIHIDDVTNSLNRRLQQCASA